MTRQGTGGVVAGLGSVALAVAAAVVLMGQAAGPSLMASGKIASVDPQQNVLKLKTGFFTTREFTVSPDARIQAGQESIKLHQLLPGAEATVEYVEQGDQHVAQAITLKADAAQSPAAAPQKENPPPKADASPAAGSSAQREIAPPAGSKPQASAPERSRASGGAGPAEGSDLHQHPDMR